MYIIENYMYILQLDSAPPPLRKSWLRPCRRAYKWFCSELAGCYSLGDRNFIPRIFPKFVQNHLFDRVAQRFVLSRHTWYLHDEIFPLVLCSSMIQKEEKESMRHRFLQFENAEVTKCIRLLHKKPEMQSVPPQNTQTIDLKWQASIRSFSIWN